MRKRQDAIKLGSETSRQSGPVAAGRRDTKGQFVAISALAEALLLRIGRERK